MAKTINFEYEGVKYTLEYTRKSVKKMEESGFNINEVENKPMTMYPMLFAGSFLAHHPFVKGEVIDKIYSMLTNKAELITTLGGMYNDTLLTLLDEPKESEGNLVWGTGM